MAIPTEFIDFIVPISTIEKKYPGGLTQCLKDHENLIGGRVWYDDYLFRDGAMSPNGISNLVEEWESLGFQGREIIEGTPHWLDFCVHESMFGGATLPCEWLISTGTNIVSHVDDHEPNNVIEVKNRLKK